MSPGAAMQNYALYVIAAACEIAGCYTAWMWLRLGRSVWWLALGMCSLALFAILLTRVDAGFAGRAFAAYGGVYIVSSLLWLAIIERARLSLSDILGVALCLAGSAVILFGTRHAG